MVFTHHVTDDTRGFLGLAAVFEAHFIHAVQHAALHGLQAVTDIREGAGDDDGHRIVDVGRPHLVVDFHLLDGPRLRLLEDVFPFFVVIHFFVLIG